jgi:hypothetical protein
MKSYLTIAALLIAGVVSAQIDSSYSGTLLKQYSNPSETAKLLSVLPNGNQVYALPQDNMPCIVPQMNQYAMPNAGDNIKTENVPGAIPNPAPKIVIPPVKKANTPMIYIDMRRKPAQP